MLQYSREMSPKSREFYPSGRDAILKTAEQWMDSKRKDDDVGKSLWRVHDKLYDLTNFISKAKILKSLSYNFTSTGFGKNFICQVNSFSFCYVYGFFKFGFDKTHRSPLQMYMGKIENGINLKFMCPC